MLPLHSQYTAAIYNKHRAGPIFQYERKCFW